MPTNDNDPCPPNAAHAMYDAHGQAALLLVESLIHGLCEKSAISAGEAVEIAERAVDVQRHYAEEAGSGSALTWRTYALLASIAASLKTDDIDGPPRPRLMP